MLLKSPIQVRRNGETVTLTEISPPEIVTVETMIKVNALSGQTKGSRVVALTGVLAGLSKQDYLKLSIADVIAFQSVIGELIEPNDEPSFEVPTIKPIASLLNSITTDFDTDQLGFAIQVLEKHGIDKQKMLKMDYREFAPAVAKVYEALFDPK